MKAYVLSIGKYGEDVRNVLVIQAPSRESALEKVDAREEKDGFVLLSSEWDIRINPAGEPVFLEEVTLLV